MLFPNPDNLLTHLLDQELVMGLGKGRGCPHTDGFSITNPYRQCAQKKHRGRNNSAPRRSSFARTFHFRGKPSHCAVCLGSKEKPDLMLETPNTDGLAAETSSTWLSFMFYPALFFHFIPSTLVSWRLPTGRE